MNGPTMQFRGRAARPVDHRGLDLVTPANDAPVGTHRVYLRLPGQRVSDKTVTASAVIARAAWDELVSRQDLCGQDVAVAWTVNGTQFAFHSFRGGSVAA